MTVCHCNPLHIHKAGGRSCLTCLTYTLTAEILNTKPIPCELETLKPDLGKTWLAVANDKIVEVAVGAVPEGMCTHTHTHIYIYICKNDLSVLFDASVCGVISHL